MFRIPFSRAKSSGSLANSNLSVSRHRPLARRLRQLMPLEGATLIQDECHHAGAKSWANVTKAIRPGRRCGLTATPVRPNGQGLGDEGDFTRLVVGRQPRELMDAGHLCDYDLFCAPASARFNSDGLHRRGGDFDTAEVAERVQQISGQIIPSWFKLNPGQLQTVTVAVTVAHAMELADQYRRAGVVAAAVVGDEATTKQQEMGSREDIFAAFRAGQIRVLIACAVIDEGLDVPEATVLQVTRPTASLRLWRQLCGRVLRPAAGKPKALIIDHTDNWHRLPMPDTAVEWSLHSPPKVERMEAVEDTSTGRVRLAAVPVEVHESDDELVALRRTQTGRLSPKDVKNWLDVTVKSAASRGDVFSLRQLLPTVGFMDVLTLRVLGESLGHPSGWAETQAWFAEMDPKVRSKSLSAARDIVEAKLRA